MLGWPGGLQPVHRLAISLRCAAARSRPAGSRWGERRLSINRPSVFWQIVLLAAACALRRRPRHVADNRAGRRQPPLDALRCWPPTGRKIASADQGCRLGQAPRAAAEHLPVPPLGFDCSLRPTTHELAARSVAPRPATRPVKRRAAAAARAVRRRRCAAAAARRADAAAAGLTSTPPAAPAARAAGGLGPYMYSSSRARPRRGLPLRSSSSRSHSSCASSSTAAAASARPRAAARRTAARWRAPRELRAAAPRAAASRPSDPADRQPQALPPPPRHSPAHTPPRRS